MGQGGAVNHLERVVHLKVVVLQVFECELIVAVHEDFEEGLEDVEIDWNLVEEGLPNDLAHEVVPLQLLV